MPYVSKEQIAAAREMDLLTYLQRFEPDELVHIGGNTYSTRTHDSLKLSNGKWCWWSQGIGGTTALDYLVKVQGLSLPEAVQRITRNTCSLSHSPSPPRASPTPFHLPPRHADERRVFSYLTQRGIDPEILQSCIQTGQLYEDAVHHNCVFVGFRDDTPVYGALRGTLITSQGKERHYAEWKAMQTAASPPLALQAIGRARGCQFNILRYQQEDALTPYFLMD